MLNQTNTSFASCHICSGKLKNLCQKTAVTTHVFENGELENAKARAPTVVNR